MHGLQSGLMTELDFQGPTTAENDASITTPGACTQPSIIQISTHSVDHLKDPRRQQINSSSPLTPSRPPPEYFRGQDTGQKLTQPCQLGPPLEKPRASALTSIPKGPRGSFPNDPHSLSLDSSEHELVTRNIKGDFYRPPTETERPTREEVQRIGSMHYCNQYHLDGHCAEHEKNNCRYVHEKRLRGRDLEVLRYLRTRLC